MNSKSCRKIVHLLLFFACFLFFKSIYGYEIFIYRPYPDKKPFSLEKKIHVHGEFFGQWQFPSTFPSYNDLSGDKDRWSYGFRNIIYLTKKTSFLAQLVTHDDSIDRTKFDWNFTLRHLLYENLVLVIGHDSDHDSDHVSLINGRRYYVNRNYLGLGLPLMKAKVYLEPFFWAFLPNTKDRVHLDLSGKDLRQEYGARIGFWHKERIGFHLQIKSQADRLFSLGQAFLADFIIRVKLSAWLELSTGGGYWRDMKASPLGNKKNFYKLIWGIAIPF
jgi:hypothetical protein